MTRGERRQVSELLRATEYILLENIALRLVLEHKEVPNWRKLLERILEDKEILAGVHLRFHDIYREIEAAEDPSNALRRLVSGLPSRKVQ
jgi:hypothetical protein